MLESRRRTRVRAVDLFHQELSEAVAPQSVAIRLEDEVDVARGDMIVHAGAAPRVERIALQAEYRNGVPVMSPL